MTEFNKLQKTNDLRKLALNASSPDTRLLLLKAADMQDQVAQLERDVATIKRHSQRVAPQWPGRAVPSQPSELCRQLERLEAAPDRL